MYKIYLGNDLVFDDEEVREDRFVEEATLELEVGKAGTLTFTVYPQHTLYNSFYKLTSYIRVDKDSTVIFKGRVLSSEENMMGARKITVEGSLAFLNDSIIRPYDFSLYTFQRKSPRELLSYYLEQHNAQVEVERRLTLGNVTVSLPDGTYLTPSTKSYDSTLNNVNKYLLQECEGYLLVRYQDGVTYVDYLSEFTTLANQTVELGKNLLDITHTIEADEIATVIIPLGNDEEVEEEYVDPDTGTINVQKVKKPITIAGVIDPDTGETITVDYIKNKSLIAQYGIIYKTVEFDCDLRIELYKQAKAYVSSMSMLTSSIELTSLDLSRIDSSLDNFRIGTKVHVKSAYHGIDDTIPVTKISVDILHPEDSQLTLGNARGSFTENNAREKQTSNKVIDKMNKDLEDDIANIDTSVNMLKLSWNSATKTAVMKQTDETRLVEYPTSSGKIFADCNDYETMHNYKVITNTPANKMVFFALYPVLENRETIYHPFFAMQVITASSIKWYDVNDVTLTTEKTDIFIVGVIDLKKDTTVLWGVARTREEANVDVFMDYLATLDDVDDTTLQTYAAATGVGNVFKKVAILEAFINKLTANEAFLKRLIVYALKVGQGNDSQGFKMEIVDGTPPTVVAKFNGSELWKIDATTGKMYGNFAEVRQYLPFQWEDSLDSTHEMECVFYIPDNALKVSIKLSAQNLKYRAYSSSAKYISESATTGEITWIKGVNTNIPVSITVNKVGLDTKVYTNTNEYFYTGAHKHSELSSSDGKHQHSITLPTSLVTGVSISSGTLLDLNHNHPVNYSHNHSLNYGIYEGTKCAGVNLYVDDGSGYGSAISSLGSDDNLASNLSIGDYFSGTGWKKIKFSSTQLGRIQAQLIVELLVTT